MPGGLLFSILKTALGLAGVCALAWVALGQLSRRGIGTASSGGRLRVVDRLSLAPRQKLYLVQADSKLLLLGAGESGAISLIAELPPSTLADAGG